MNSSITPITNLQCEARRRFCRQSTTEAFEDSILAHLRRCDLTRVEGTGLNPAALRRGRNEDSDHEPEKALAAASERLGDRKSRSHGVRRGVGA